MTGGQSGLGGGVYTYRDGGKTPGSLTVMNSTINGNFALSDGGGIACGYSGLTIINSTISGNSAGAYGGGIVAGSFGMMIVDSTVSSNSAATCGGVCGAVEIGNNPERERVWKHRGHCHVARLQHQQRRWRWSFKRPRRSDQHQPAAWSPARSRWTNAHAYADAGQPCD